MGNVWYHRDCLHFYVCGNSVASCLPRWRLSLSYLLLKEVFKIFMWQRIWLCTRGSVSFSLIYFEVIFDIYINFKLLIPSCWTLLSSCSDYILLIFFYLDVYFISHNMPEQLVFAWEIFSRPKFTLRLSCALYFIFVSWKQHVIGFFLIQSEVCLFNEVVCLQLM